MLELTDSDFSAHTKNGIVVVDFWADWCSPCKAIAPVYEKVAEVFPNAVFAKVNIEDCTETTRNNHISSIPSVFIFKDGVVVDKIVGLFKQEKLENAVKKALDSVVVADKSV